MTDPANPSQLFLGEIAGAIGCLPNSTPAAYPPVSEATTTIRKVSTRCAPLSGATSSVANDAKNITYSVTKTEAETSRR